MSFFSSSSSFFFLAFSLFLYSLSIFSPNSNLDALSRQGPEGTVYEGGTFDLSVSIP